MKEYAVPPVRPVPRPAMITAKFDEAAARVRATEAEKAISAARQEARSAARRAAREARLALRLTNYAALTEKRRQAAKQSAIACIRFSLYGVTREAYERLLEVQERRCAICRRSPSECSRAFAVDHDHVTGKVRGLLCNRCNLALGSFQDSEELLSTAIAYLRRHALK